MNFLGIDYGTKRVGVAVSDEEGKVAFPMVVFSCDKELVGEVKKICADKKVEMIIIGESKNFAGEDNSLMVDIKKFVEELKKETGLSVILEPEFLTSTQASRIQGNVKGLDASAAAIILQSYLDKRKNLQGELSSVQKAPSLKISYDDFQKVEIKVGKILSAEKIPETGKLLRLMVDFGEEKPRQIVSGIALYFSDIQVLVEKKCLFVTNLEPRVIKGYESNGMILALSTEDRGFSLLEPNSSIPIGTKVR